MLIRHVLAYLPARVIPAMVNFLALALYTRLLDPAAYGRYVYVLAVVGLVQSLLFNWLRLGMARFYQGSQRDNQLPVLLSTVAGGLGVTGLAVAAGWGPLLSLWPLDQALRSALWLGLPLLLVQALFQQCLDIHRAALDPRRYGLLTTARSVLGLVASLSLILALGLAERGVLLGLLLGTLVTVLVDLPRWRKQVSLRLAQRATAATLLRYGAPFTLTFAFGFVVSTSDRFLLEHFLGSESVGLYAVGYDLTQQALTLLFMVVNTAAYPLVIRSLEQGGQTAARAELRQNALLMFALMLPASVGFAMVSPLVSGLLLGSAFREVAAKIMPWIALSTFLLGVKSYYLDLAFQLGRRTGLQVFPVAAAALLNIALNLWWIPLLGLMGAVYSTVAAYAVALLMSLALGFKAFPIPFPLGKISRLGMATFSMAAVLWLLPVGEGWLSLGLLVFTGAGAYGAAVWLLGVLVPGGSEIYARPEGYRVGGSRGTTYNGSSPDKSHTYDRWPPEQR